MATRKTSSKKTGSRKSSGSKTGARKTSAAKTKRRSARKTSKRTLLEPHAGDRRYVRRNKKGEFKSEVSVGRSLAADRRRKSSTKVAKGQGDRGDTSPGVVGTIRRILKKI